MTELLIRFLVGGALVSAFAAVGTILKPKSFAGLFGASPAIALATLILTAQKDGPAYASIEARSGILGAIAFFAYAYCVMKFIAGRKRDVKIPTYGFLLVWFLVAFGLWWVLGLGRIS
jgi:uncharacterized membrane protein (GlpM family)